MYKERKAQDTNENYVEKIMSYLEAPKKMTNLYFFLSKIPIAIGCRIKLKSNMDNISFRICSVRCSLLCKSRQWRQCSIQDWVRRQLSSNLIVHLHILLPRLFCTAGVLNRFWACCLHWLCDETIQAGRQQTYVSLLALCLFICLTGGH